jgi:predicted CXXCH cytochrome family protein
VAPPSAAAETCASAPIAGGWFRLIAEEASDGDVVPGSDLKLHHANHAAARLTGRPGHELIGPDVPAGLVAQRRTENERSLLRTVINMIPNWVWVKDRAGVYLTSTFPALCQTCHARKEFTGKSTHTPVQAGTCGACPDPHACDQVGLLTKDTATLCLECRDRVRKKPHAIAGFSRNGHPLGDEKLPAAVADRLLQTMAPDASDGVASESRLRG